ncbi:unnamed protein product [Linum trigynum]|uniref:Uncharacterized protein n=1 Tax=Linum trigynum TaxID=586398 RepID=A0AAV2DAK0_9ROSI
MPVSVPSEAAEVSLWERKTVVVAAAAAAVDVAATSVATETVVGLRGLFVTFVASVPEPVVVLSVMCCYGVATEERIAAIEAAVEYASAADQAAALQPVVPSRLAVELSADMKSELAYCSLGTVAAEFENSQLHAGNFGLESDYSQPMPGISAVAVTAAVVIVVHVVLVAGSVVEVPVPVAAESADAVSIVVVAAAAAVFAVAAVVVAFVALVFPVAVVVVGY